MRRCLFQLERFFQGLFDPSMPERYSSPKNLLSESASFQLLRAEFRKSVGSESSKPKGFVVC